MFMMAIIARLLVLLPLALSVGAAILSALALFAGHNKGFMEDFAIVRLNTSDIGHNVFHFADNNSNDDNKRDGILGTLGGDIEGEFNKLKNKIDNKIENALNNVTGSIADELAKELGISEWYSVHVMDSCDGNYKPNVTAKSPSLKVTNCTHSGPGNHLNLTKVLNDELEQGPFNLTLTDIKWPSSVQSKINDINDVLLALFVLYVLAFGLSGLGALCSLGSFALADSRAMVLINFALAASAALVLLISSIAVTVAVTKGTHAINKVGKDVGVHASQGNNFLTLTWIAAGFMVIASGLWTMQFCVAWRLRKRATRPAAKGSL